MSVKYITNRIAFADQSVRPLELLSHLEKCHGRFFHVFNLGGANQQYLDVLKGKVSSYKNRAYPFSLKETFNICLLLDKFLRMKIGNVAVLFDPKGEFACFVASCYLYLCGKIQNLTESHQYCCKKLTLPPTPPQLFTTLHKMYSLRQFHPIAKIIKSIKVSSMSVPIFQILTQSKFQQLTLSYRHQIQPKLQQYYFNLPNAKYCDMQPRTEFLISPAVVVGDFAIRFYNYENLKHEFVFTVAMNTVFLQGVERVEVKAEDLYPVRREGLREGTVVTIEFQEFCGCKTEQTFDERCYYCANIVKTLKKDYTELKQLITEFNRVNDPNIATMLCFGKKEFDDIQTNK